MMDILIPFGKHHILQDTYFANLAKIILSMFRWVSSIHFKTEIIYLFIHINDTPYCSLLLCLALLICGSFFLGNKLSCKFV